jgi:DNA repair protein RadA/Sms
MAKIKTSFFCNNCGYESTKWLGKCPTCNEWNTFIEEVVEKNKSQEWKGYTNETKQNKVIALNNVTTLAEKRINTYDDELNRVLGGGIVLGSLILVAGEPGIGKSTLFLQHGLMMKMPKGFIY